jgi:hypothetical protein
MGYQFGARLMGQYEQLTIDLWDHPRFQALTVNARMLYLWAWLNGRSRIAGVFVATDATVRLEAGLSSRATFRAVDELRERMLRRFGTIWWVVPKAKRAVSPQQQMGVVYQVAPVTAADFRAEWAATYPGLVPEAWSISAAGAREPEVSAVDAPETEEEAQGNKEATLPPIVAKIESPRVGLGQFSARIAHGGNRASYQHIADAGGTNILYENLAYCVLDAVVQHCRKEMPADVGAYYWKALMKRYHEWHLPWPANGNAAGQDAPQARG